MLSFFIPSALAQGVNSVEEEEIFLNIVMGVGDLKKQK